MVFSYAKLRGRIRECFKTQEAFAKELGISRTSLNLRLCNISEFSQNEILKASKLLGLSGSEIDAYFFTLEVQKTEQDEPKGGQNHA